MTLSRPQITGPGHASSTEGGCKLRITSAHQWHAVWVPTGMQHIRSHIHCSPVTRVVPCCPRDAVHGRCRSGKGIRSCTQKCCLVGSSQVGAYERVVRVLQSMYENARTRVHVGCNPSGVKSSVWKWVFTKALARPPYFNHGSGSLLPRVSHRMSPRKPVCWWPGHLLWVAGGTARKADPLEDENKRKGITWENWCSDIWARSRCASEVRQRALCRVPLVRSHKPHLCSGWSRWARKRYCGTPDTRKIDPSFRCELCCERSRPVDGRPVTKCRVGREKLEVGPSFCYLGGCLSSVAELNWNPPFRQGSLEL